MSELATKARVAAKLLVRDLLIGCGDNSCRFKHAVVGMGTNGGCRCAEKIQDQIERIANEHAATLESDLAHRRSQAGPDSCADYVKKNEALVAALKSVKDSISRRDEIEEAHEIIDAALTVEEQRKAGG